MKTTLMPRVGVIMTVLLLGATLVHAQGTQLLVSNVQAQQRPFTATWDVTYDLETVGDIAVTVNLSLSTDLGATYPDLCATVSGDVGAGVLPGTGKHIVWDAGAEFPGLSSATCRLRVTADDGQVGAPAGFVAIPPGTFMMGSPTTELGRSTNENQHQVTLTHGFYMQTTEVTNQQYRDLAQWAYRNGYVTATSAGIWDNLDGSTQKLRELGSGFHEMTFSAGTFSCINPTHPVKFVTWYGAVAYCDWLSLQQGLPRAYNHSTWQCDSGNPYTATGYRLPTEAEWEYACRAISTTAFANGPITSEYCNPIDPNLNLMGWYCANAGGWTHPVAQKTANAWGLSDMHGNSIEWCNDLSDFGTYGGTVTDPVGAAAGDYRVLRGGQGDSDARSCRSASRSYGSPSVSFHYLGIRPARSSNSALPQTGTVIIYSEPNDINAPWQIAGPEGFSLSGVGDLTLYDMIPGAYTLTWEAVLGWTKPIPVTVTQTLVVGGVVTIAGLYEPDVFVSIPPGTFMMGSPTTEPNRDTNETQHQVTLTHGLYMQTTEVTNLQYRDMAQWAYDNGHVTATSASIRDNLDGSTQILKELGALGEITFSAGVFSCVNPTHPVKWVTWYGSVAYCDWLSLKQGLPRAYNHSTWQCNAGNPYTATGYRLPTEAEWEYACRAGTQTPFNTGSCLDAGTEANYNGGYPYTGCPTGPYVSRTAPVGSCPANAFGLYDMHGNLWEMCNDWYGAYGGAVTDPVGAGAGSNRVIRGGSWNSYAQYCRSAIRTYVNPTASYETFGFRPVRSSS